MRFMLGIAACGAVVSLSCFLMAGTMLATGTKETSFLWLIPMVAVGLVVGGVVAYKVED